MNYYKKYKELLEQNHGLQKELQEKAVEMSLLKDQVKSLEKCQRSREDNTSTNPPQNTPLMQVKSALVIMKGQKSPSMEQPPSRIPVFNCPIYRKYILHRQYPIVAPESKKKDTILRKKQPPSRIPVFNCPIYRKYILHRQYPVVVPESKKKDTVPKEQRSRKQKANMKRQVKRANRSTVAIQLRPIQTKKTCPDKDVFLPSVKPVVGMSGKAGSGAPMAQRNKPLPPIRRNAQRGLSLASECEKPVAAAFVPHRPEGNPRPSQRARRSLYRKPTKSSCGLSESQSQVDDCASLALKMNKLMAQVESIVQDVSLLKRERAWQGGDRNAE